MKIHEHDENSNNFAQLRSDINSEGSDSCWCRFRFSISLDRNARRIDFRTHLENHAATCDCVKIIKSWEKIRVRLNDNSRFRNVVSLSNNGDVLAVGACL